MSAVYYSVDFVICVDRPDRRDASFPEVPARTRISQRWDYRDQASAVRVFDSIMAGQWDFASEYMAVVSVTARDVYTGLRSRTVRKRTERTRRAGAGQCGYDCGHALCAESAARDRADGLVPGTPESELANAYRDALAAEHGAVEAAKNDDPASLKRAWEASDKTNRALVALQTLRARNAS